MDVDPEDADVDAAAFKDVWDKCKKYVTEQRRYLTPNEEGMLGAAKKRGQRLSLKEKRRTALG